MTTEARFEVRPGPVAEARDRARTGRTNVARSIRSARSKGTTAGRRRTAVQATSAGLFVGLFLLAVAGGEVPAAVRGWVPVDLYFLADPLLGLTAALTAPLTLGAPLAVPLVAGAVLLVATALFGRFFCGYVCPLGACFDWTAPRGAGASRTGLDAAVARWRWIKHALLATLLVAALAGIPAAWLLDPLAILWRGLALLVYPLALAGAGLGLDGAGAVLESVISTTPFAVSVPHRIFAGAVVSGVLLGGVLAMNRFAHRLWCRTACPLGGLLSVVGARPLLRRRVAPETCLACSRCRDVCPMGALAAGPGGGAPAECLVCLRCVDACPTGSVSVELAAPTKPLLPIVGAPRREGSGEEDSRSDRRRSASPPALDRRRFLGGTACALGGVLVLDRTPWPGSGFGPGTEGGPGSVWASGAPLRPPGVRSEAELLDRCVRCGVCMQACPTNVIQPDLSPARFTGLFAPELVLRLGGCDPACTRCGEVCPTGAIRPLAPEDKRAWMLGTAVVEDERCVRTDGEDCRACVEVCPYEAFEPALSPGATPRVLAERCTGCGLCEFRCPVPPRDGSRRARRAALRPAAGRRPAIRVVTVAEARRLAPTLREEAPPRDDSHLPLFLRSS